MSSEPLVSIGVPVYNDAPWLRNTLDHLLAQDYCNLEIILADDGSTDGSREICREYARRDARIRLFENKHNLGAVGNHKFVFDVSTGDYFAWGSGHDYNHPSFVSRTLEVLQANPSVVMSCSQSVFVSEKGAVLRTTKGGLDTRGLPPAERFRELLVFISEGGTANVFYGLYRQEALTQVDLSRKVFSCDLIMLGELSLFGEMKQVDEVLFYRMMNRGETNQTARQVKFLIDARGFSVEALMPYFSMMCEYLNMIENSGLSAAEKQSVNEEVLKALQLFGATITDEIKQFIAVSRSEMRALESLPLARQYRAAQILSALELAWLLGFDCERLHQVRSICLAALGLEAEARTAAQEEAKARLKEKMQGMLRHYRHRLAGILHRLSVSLRNGR